MGNFYNKTWRDEIDGEPVYIKQYLTRENRTAEDICRRAEREAELLKRQEVIGTSSRHLGALQIVDVDGPSGTIATREIDGRSLEDLLRGSYRTQPAQSRRALMLTGRWLKEFHELEVDQTDLAGDTVRAFLDFCDLRINPLIEGGRLSEQERTPVRSALTTLLKATDAPSRRITWCHCDYAPFNVFWDGNVLTPLDFEMCKPALAMTDVTYFIHRIEMMRAMRPWKRWPVSIWRRAFLRGYGDEQLVATPMYRACMIRHILCRMLSMQRDPQLTWKRRLHNRLVHRGLRRDLFRLVRTA